VFRTPPSFSILRFIFAAAALAFLSGCSTVSDLVVSHIPDGREGRAKIVVNLREQKAILYKGKFEVAESRISTGREGYDTPAGRFKIIRKDQGHRSSLYGDYLDQNGKVVKANVDVRKVAKPPGAVFEGAPMPYFLEFSPSYGFHAGNLPGYPASHGCVRMPYWKARQFFKTAKVGTPVVITR